MHKKDVIQTNLCEELAYEMADETVVAEIESGCKPISAGLGNDCWFDTTDRDPFFEQSVSRALAYIILRGNKFSVDYEVDGPLIGFLK